eukprot:4677176-Heterocapsa_arctica.AAC.1
MDTLRVRRQRLNVESIWPTKFRNTSLGTTSDTFSTRWLGKMRSTTTRSKVHPQDRKADISSDLNKWDMKFKPV